MVRELRADGWECHVAVPSKPRLAAEYAAAGAVLHVVPMRRLTLSGSTVAWAVRYLATWPVAVLRLALLAHRLDVDVVHTNSLHYLHGWAAALLARRPHLWHAREIVAQSGAALRLERMLARRFAVVVVAGSGAIADQLIPGNVEVVVDRPDPEEFSPRHAGRLRASLGIADDAPVVAAASRLDTWKGIDVLLDAVPAIAAGRPGTVVVVAGGPVGGKEAYARQLARRAADLGVVWLGVRRDVADLWADADVAVGVSTLPEPFGLGLVEALASGTPVVATAGGGPLEILACVLGPDGRPAEGAGALVPFSDPAATAAAVLGLLPYSTSTALRSARPALHPRWEEGRTLAQVVDGILADQLRPAVRSR